MLDRMSAREFAEWAIYFSLEHLGESPEERADLRSAIVAATTANANRGKGRAAKLDDFMPRFEDAEQSPQQLHQSMIALARQGERRNGNPG